jgi:hypothetical protein
VLHCVFTSVPAKYTNDVPGKLANSPLTLESPTTIEYADGFPTEANDPPN